VIDAIKIKNFQSHKQTHIEFSEGVNIITGASDQGKSAILRALLWAIRNRPLGTDGIVSHWIRDAKNKIDGEMSVKIYTDNGAVKRKRTAESNEYTVFTGENDSEQKTFAAVKGDVPQDVADFLRMPEVCIQEQHDAPFLLSASPSKVAEFFNRIVRLDVIDTVLSNAESARRETNKRIKETESKKIALEKELESYNWIETAQELADKLIKIDERIKTYRDDSDSINGDIRTYQTTRKELEDVPDIKSANNLIEKIEKIVINYDGAVELEKEILKYREVNRDRKIFSMIESGKDLINGIEDCDKIIISHESDVSSIERELEEYSENEMIANLGFDKKRVLELLTEIESIRPNYDTLRELHYQVLEYDKAQEIITEAIGEIDTLKAQLPDVCSECGQSLTEIRE